MEADVYRTLEKPSAEILFKDRKSKFFGYAFPIDSEAQVKPLIEALRKQHHTANHVCYAWQLGTQKVLYRANDDGEPNNSAGMPIYGQIQSFEVTNVLVAVARIFGGTKLGVGGLIQAYRMAAQMALENATIIEKIVTSHFQLDFDYPQMDQVMRAIKQKNLAIISQKMEMGCTVVISVRQGSADAVFGMFQQMHRIAVKKLD
ncbi:IMPACT family protein [Flagellimonas myxillae]|uniref:IMPACT family protein n=1 Tax=Flagellimonas myxillae TaxID=2942214 RepID=UPI00201EF1AC|nr:YigZ family protein [Muricauda myxillae]MCL6265646.1 YigZ family protein [Muricauda myxillae]